LTGQEESATAGGSRIALVSFWSAAQIAATPSTIFASVC
jgi:hypothetical protein